MVHPNADILIGVLILANVILFVRHTIRRLTPKKPNQQFRHIILLSRNDIITNIKT